MTRRWSAALGVLALAPLAAVPGVGSAQATPAAELPETEYAPSPAYPHGRRNPEAPPELEQFEFMIGEFDCQDAIRQPDGTWDTFPTIWNARYFLNGWGVQDEYWSPRFSTSNIRIFDPAAGRWKITYFRMPRYGSGVWEGVMEGDRLVFRNGGRTEGPGLTFYEMTDDGFKWHSGGDEPGWTSTCVRRR